MTPDEEVTREQLRWLERLNDYLADEEDGLPVLICQLITRWHDVSHDDRARVVRAGVRYLRDAR